MITLNKKYENLIKHTGKYFIISGGRGSSKSFSISVYLILLTFQHGEKILFSRLTMTSAHLSIIPEIVNVLTIMDIVDKFHILKTKIINKETLSEINFMGLKNANGEQSARLKGLSGITCFVCDEAEELQQQEALFDKINLTIRKEGVQNRVILILNPSTKSHWIYTRFFLQKSVKPGFNGFSADGSVCYVHTTFKDNIRNLSKEFLEDVRNLKNSNLEKFNHIVLGGWLERAEGVIFSSWEYGTFPKDQEIIFGADWGFTDPNTLIGVVFDIPNKKLYVKQYLYQKGMNVSDVTKTFKKVCGDNLVIADPAQPVLIEENRLKGVNIIPAKKPPGSVKQGIFLMQDFQIIVDHRSKDIANELNNYSWQAKNEEPIDKWNHCIDAIRYVVLYKIQEKNTEWFIL